jgi:uncharacterized oxidoreductase
VTLYKYKSLELFVSAILEGSGSSAQEAQIVAEHLVDADLVGHSSHGVIRLGHYLAWLDKGWVKSNQLADVVQDNGAILVIDGGFGYGQVIAKDSMTRALARMDSDGVCIVAIRNASHVGRLGAWAEMLAEQGMVSIHFANTSGFGIRVAPFGGIERRFSTNPICVGIPVENSDPIILDMATAKIPEGKILVAINKGEDVQEDLILNGAGEPTRDPQGFFDEPQGAVLPIAGPKGSGLAFVIEALAGALTGGGSGHPNNPTADMVVNNMFSIVINPDRVSGRDFFGQDIDRLIEWTKSSRPVTPDGEVLVPGEIERRTKLDRQSNGIPLDDATVNELVELATRFGVEVPNLAMGAT